MISSEKEKKIHFKKLTFTEKFIEYLRLVRYWEWPDKINLYAASLLLLLAFGHVPTVPFFDLTIFVIYLFIPFSFGFLINSYADRKMDVEIDRDQFGYFSRETVRQVLILLGVLTVTMPLLFRSWMIMGITLGMFFLAGSYSMKPIRFKERGFFGILIAVVTMRIPFLFLYILIPDNAGLITFLLIWQCLCGILIEFSHQVKDFDNDRQTHTKTYATLIGKEESICAVKRWVRVLLVFNLLPIGAVFLGLLDAKAFLFSAVLMICSHTTVVITYNQLGQKNKITEFHFIRNKGN